VGSYVHSWAPPPRTDAGCELIAKPNAQTTQRGANSLYTEKTDREGSLEKQIKELQLQLQLSHRQKRNTEAIIYGIRDAVVVIDELTNC